ncbi:MAG: glycosyltransferase [Pseudomonadota bacterium]
MKILQVMAGGQHGGAEMAFIDMCVAMKEKGLDIEVVTRKNKVRDRLLDEAKIKTHHCRFGGIADFITSQKIKKIIQSYEPDIVQSWMSRASVKTPSWNKTQTKKKYYTIARLGGYYSYKYFKHIDYFAAITPDLKKHIESWGINPEHVRQLNNFAETEQDIIPIDREELDTPKDATVIVSLARYHENKALDILIRSLPDLPNCYLWLAGDGPLKDTLHDLAKSLHVESRVRFLGWRTDRAALLQAADICAFVSRHEPFGSVFIQAWANKIPLIVSDAQGPVQFCKHEKDSLVIPKNNEAAFVRAVHKLEADPVFSIKLVNNGYQKYLDGFTKEKSVEAYLDFYRDILKTRST